MKLPDSGPDRSPGQRTVFGSAKLRAGDRSLQMGTRGLGPEAGPGPRFPGVADFAPSIQTGWFS